MKKFALYFSITTLIFFVCNSVYAFFLYHVLHFDISLRMMFLLAFMSIAFGGLLFVSSRWWWRISMSIVALIYGLYHLVSFVYLDIYRTFFSFSALHVNQQSTMLKTIQDFYAVVPLSVYSATVVYSILLITLICIINKKFRYNVIAYPLPHGYVLRHTRHASYVYLVALCIAVAGIGGGAWYAHYVHVTPKEKATMTSILTDKGITGNIFFRIFELTQKKEPFLPIEPVLAEHEQQAEHIPQKQMTPRDVMKHYIAQLKSPAAENSDTAMLPVFETKPHIVHIQLESVPLWGIQQDPSPMPFLKELMQQEIHVDTFFANNCRTIDAEFATLCSFFPDATIPAADAALDKQMNCLPSILRDDYGYDTTVVHGNVVDFWNRDKLDPAWGFEELHFPPEYLDTVQLDDSIWLSHITDILARAKSPQMIEFISFTSHAPHSPEHLEEIGRVSDMTMDTFEGTIDPDVVARNELDEYPMRVYFSSLKNVDNALKKFVTDLKQKRLWDNTLLVITNDHKYYDFLGDDERNFDLENNQPFVLHIPGMSGQRVPLVASHIDIAPTLLHILTGTTDTIPDNFIGTSLFDRDHPNAAINFCYDKVTYVTPHDKLVGHMKSDYFLSLFSDVDHDSSYIKKTGDILINMRNLTQYMLGADVLVDQE